MAQTASTGTTKDTYLKEHSTNRKGFCSPNQYESANGVNFCLKRIGSYSIVWRRTFLVTSGVINWLKFWCRGFSCRGVNVNWKFFFKKLSLHKQRTSRKVKLIENLLQKLPNRNGKSHSVQISPQWTDLIHKASVLDTRYPRELNYPHHILRNIALLLNLFFQSLSLRSALHRMNTRSRRI